MPCPGCHGTGTQQRYLELTVSWTNWVATETVVRGEPPKELLDVEEKAVLYEEEQRQLYARPPGPPTHAHGGTRVNEAVHEAINAALNDADTLPGGKRIRRQRVSVRGVPIHHGRYVWKGRQGDFWIQGRGKRILAPDYPSSTRRMMAVLGAIGAALGLLVGAAAVLTYWEQIRGLVSG